MILRLPVLTSAVTAKPGARPSSIERRSVEIETRSREDSAEVRLIYNVMILDSHQTVLPAGSKSKFVMPSALTASTNSAVT